MKPKAKLLGADSNVFNLLAIASASLKKAKLADQAKEMQNRVLGCGSFDEALCIIMEYVEVY